MRRTQPLVACLVAFALLFAGAAGATESATTPGEDHLVPVDYCPPSTCSDCYLIVIPLPEGGTYSTYDCLSLGDGSLGWQQCFPATSGGGCVLAFRCDIFGVPGDH